MSLILLEQIQQKVQQGIEKRNFDIDKIKKVLDSEGLSGLKEELEFLTQNFRFFDESKKLNRFGTIFHIIKNHLVNYKGKSNNSTILISEEFFQQFIKGLTKLLVLEKFCSKCNSRNIENLFFPISEENIIYFCRNCRQKVRVFHRSQHLPIFLIYVKDWEKRKLKKGRTRELMTNAQEFLQALFSDCFNYFSEVGELSALIFFHEIMTKNDIYHDALKDKELFRDILIANLKKSLENQNFYDFIQGASFYKNLGFGNIKEDVPNLLDIILNSLIESLKAGKPIKVKKIVDFLFKEDYFDLYKKLSDARIKDRLETNYYQGLAKCLEDFELRSFQKLIEYSDKFDIFIDVQKIPNRFEYITNLLSESTQSVNLGQTIEILRFINEYNLVEIVISKEKMEFLEEFKTNSFFMSNLRDLFGEVSNSFILYVHDIMPEDLYNRFIQEGNAFFTDPDQMAVMIMQYFKKYVIYGLSVEALGTTKSFLNRFEKHYLIAKNQGTMDKLKFIEFSFRGRTHMVSPANILKNWDKIEGQLDYNFYSLSMVMLGGLGPQGHGFTYSTPRGEVVEICSDIRENEAIIIKYKQFLKRKFLNKLELEMKAMGIDGTMSKEIIGYLLEALNNEDLISYQKKELILKQINGFLHKSNAFQDIRSGTFTALVDNISNAIDVILRPISMVDQFRCRMDLITDDKIKSEDIAKLTSLKSKSHFDVLRERFFFQFIIKRFSEVYSTKKKSSRPF